LASLSATPNFWFAEGLSAGLQPRGATIMPDGDLAELGEVFKGLSVGQPELMRR